jgi:hypothetical protein
MEMEEKKELTREKREEQEQTAAEERAPVELYA